MMELDEKIFGKITAKEILGAEPPEIPDTRDNLDKELAILLVELESQSKENLEKILEEQKTIKNDLDSKTGAMALPQNKIRLFTGYNEKYIQKIKEKLEL